MIRPRRMKTAVGDFVVTCRSLLWVVEEADVNGHVLSLVEARVPDRRVPKVA